MPPVKRDWLRLYSCDEGHRWQHVGGMNAGCDDACGCSVPVFQCAACGDFDYGENEEAAEVRAMCIETKQTTAHDWPGGSFPLICTACASPFAGPPDGGLCLACWQAVEWVEINDGSDTPPAYPVAPTANRLQFHHECEGKK